MELQVTRVHHGDDSGLQISDLLLTPVMTDYHQEQQKDEVLKILYDYLVNESLPPDEQQARKICAKAVNFAVVDNILYFIDPKQQGRRRAAVPAHL